MTKSRTTRPAALALAVLMAAALGACSKSEQDQAARQVDPAAAKTAEAGREMKADVQEAGRDATAAARDATADAKQAGQELKADAASATSEVRAEAAHAGAAVKAAVDDAAITASISAKLAKDADLSALRIDVDTKDGTVTLSGPAPTQAAKDRASQLAREVEGVKNVTNNLKVG